MIRDTARTAAMREYYLIEDARGWTVSDLLIKKELIVEGMGQGHLPRYFFK